MATTQGSPYYLLQSAQASLRHAGCFESRHDYSATQNNGRITSMQDVVSGETITYQYDSLNRLMSAAGTGDAQGAWSQTFTYDGFGNLMQKAGSNAPNVTSWTIDPTKNQIMNINAQYDANGNMTQYGPTGSIQHFSFDIANRLTVGPSLTAGASTSYGYDAANHRVYAGTSNGSTYSGEAIYFYGADGKKLGVWTASYQGAAVILTNASINQWFGGRLLKAQDRLQSRGKYFPYGEDRYSPSPANPANDTAKFATYTRDSASGLDYANQRYYAAGLGRFVASDPYELSGRLRHPQSWNRYTYVEGDPVSFYDVLGNDIEYVGSGPCSVGQGEDIQTTSCDYYVETDQGNNEVKKNRPDRDDSRYRNVEMKLSRAIAAALKALDDPDCRRILGAPSEFNYSGPKNSDRAIS